jgi:hypothetical protein
MARSKWPLFAALTVAAFLMSGVAVWKVIVPAPLRQPYDIKGLGLGTQSTLVITLSTDCKACLESMEFYKSLMRLPSADGTARRIVAVAMDGVAPVAEIVDPAGFKPHRLTSGPYMFRSLPGVSKPGSVLLLDSDGRQLRKWVGALSAAQQQEIVRAFSRPKA